MTHNSPHRRENEPDLVSIAAHDLKTPIAALKYYLELLPIMGTLNETQQDFMHKAQGVLQRMENLVRDLLELSELDHHALALKAKRTEVRALVQGELEMLASAVEAKQLTVHLSIQDSADVVMGDSERLQQVFNNLLTNAVKYNKDNGEIWVTARRQGDLVRIDIRDTGAGIALEDQPHIFERFYRPRSGQRDRTSTGLGLAITHMIVERHNGCIWVNSTPGEGSTFSLVLPSTRASMTYEPRQHSLESSDGLDDRMQDSDEQGTLDSNEQAL